MVIYIYFHSFSVVLYSCGVIYRNYLNDAPHLFFLVYSGVQQVWVKSETNYCIFDPDFLWFPLIWVSIFMSLCVARWNWTYGNIKILLTSAQNVDNMILVRSQLNCGESGELRTTGNIGTSLSLNILREVWDKLIIFTRTWLGVSFTIFHVEGEGKNIGV